MFGVSSYKRVLSGFLDGGFRFGDFTSEHDGKVVHLRHDVDFSVEKALDIAKVEHEMGVRATYFLMLSSNTYNLVGASAQEAVRAIAEMGHRITLHFDPTVYADIDQGFEVERALFESLFAVRVELASIHRPGAFLEDNNRSFAGCAHTYQDRFFKDMTYLSDSGGRNIIDRLSDLARQEQLPRPLHVLLHPIWWACSTDSPTETLKLWLKERERFLIEETRLNCRTFEA